MVNPNKLPLVDTLDQVRLNIQEFHKNLGYFRRRAALICGRQYYWVYDPSQKKFGPSTFVACKDMTYAKYDAILATGRVNSLSRANQSGILNALVGRFEKNKELEEMIASWMRQIFGEDVMGHWSRYKWRFTTLPENPNVEDRISEKASRKETTDAIRDLWYGLRKDEIDAIDDRAMEAATEYLSKQLGYKVHNKSKSESYDLLCTKHSKELCVEVKGTTGSGNSFFISKNEVGLSRDYPDQMALIFVRNIVLHRGKKPYATGGDIEMRHPWDATDDADVELIPLQYECRLRS